MVSKLAAVTEMRSLMREEEGFGLLE